MTVFRLVAPRHLREGHVIQITGCPITIPAGGVVEIEDYDEVPGSTQQTDYGVDGPTLRFWRPRVRELLALGFQHVPPSGGVADRSAGRYDGEQWFDTYLGKPVWWSNGAWRDALGKLA